ELAFGKKGRGRDIKVHASRVILLNEGGDFNSPESGVPLLEPGYNKLLDLEKTSGGSAEGFLKNASRQLGIKLTKDVDLRQLEEGAKALGFTSFSEALNDKIKKINTGTDSALVTQEGDAPCYLWLQPIPNQRGKFLQMSLPHRFRSHLRFCSVSRRDDWQVTKIKRTGPIVVMLGVMVF
ncbi:hypothetical protein ACI3PA_12160, partial [Glaesserella parasuis]|nr:hypothetical protein [Glaesserella parasuis]